MTPIEFPNQTTILHANPNQLEIDGQEVGKLPIFTDGSQTVSCWGLTWKERFRALFCGKVWLGIYSGRTQPPVWMSVERSPFQPANTAPIADSTPSTESTK